MVNRDADNPHGDYRWGTLTLDELDPDPIAQFRKWFDESAPHMPIPDAATLATVDEHGAPDARVVLCRGVDDDGFVFYTNYNSAKGQQLAHNNAATMLFFWDRFERQVRIRGPVHAIDAARSDAYFQRRPRGSQIAATASAQSEVIASRDELETRVADLTARLDGQPIPRPSHWGGYKLVATTIEFWQGRESRLHDRLKYKKTKTWQIERLAP